MTTPARARQAGGYSAHVAATGVDGAPMEILAVTLVDPIGNQGGTVTIPETTFYNDSTANLTATSTFTGAARDAGVAAGTPTPNTYFNAMFFADQVGTASIECSNDNATWRTIASVALVASTPSILSVPVMTRYHRVKLINGATGQGALMINSSYSGA